MSRLSSIVRFYTKREPLLIIILTMTILFLDGILSAYHLSLAIKLSHWNPLSSVEWVAHLLGPILLEPVLLFAIVFYVGFRAGEPLSLIKLVPGLVCVVIAGTFLGGFVGAEILRVKTPMITILYTNLLTPHPLTLLDWQEVAEPFVHNLFTTLAALGLANSSKRE